MQKFFRKIKRKYSRVSPPQNDYYLQMMAKHQRTFKCAICGCPSSAPILIRISDDRLEMSDLSGLFGGALEQEDWETPKDLKQCPQCGLFFCRDHMGQHACLHCQNKSSQDM